MAGSSIREGWGLGLTSSAYGLIREGWSLGLTPYAYGLTLDLNEKIECWSLPAKKPRDLSQWALRKCVQSMIPIGFW